MLDGYVQILDYLALARYYVYELVVQLVGVEVVQAYPIYALDFAHFGEQARKVPAGEVAAVAGQILRDQYDFPVSVTGEFLGFSEYVLRRAGAESPAYARNEAVRAVIVAALRYEKVGPGRAGAYQAAALADRGVVVADYHGLFAFSGAIEHVANLLAGAYSYDGVHFRQFGEHLLFEELGETAGDYQQFEAAISLETGGLKYGVYGLLFGVLYERAGVHNYGLGLQLVRHYLMPGLAQQVEHLLGGHPVFRFLFHAHSRLLRRQQR